MSTPKPVRTSVATGLPTPGHRQSVGGASSSGLPTPSRRKISLGPTNAPSSGLSASSSFRVNDEEADNALQEVLRNRPPPGAGLSASVAGGNSPSSSARATPSGTRTPSGGSSGLSARYGAVGGSGSNLSASTSAATPALPRTPASGRTRVVSSGASLRSSTLAQSTLGTPGASSRAVSSVHTPSAASRRTSLAPVTPQPISSRTRQSLSRSTLSRPAVPHNENATPLGADNLAGWEPSIGDPVRIKSMGMEGTIRFIGTVQGKQGIWVGVELDPGFEGRGKNDGSVDGTRYFDCKPLCGIFTQKAKLSPPEVRPASVASSYRSGRMTPAMSIGSGASGRDSRAENERTPQQSQTSGVPSVNTPLGKSNRANMMHPPPVPNSITAGSRAAALANMSAKQLAAQKALAASDGTLKDTASPATPGSALAKSTSTITPRAPRYSVTSTQTPSRTPSVASTRRYGRDSVAGGASSSLAKPVTPSISRSGRASAASGRLSVASSAYSTSDRMPPPPSPNKYGTLGQSASSGGERQLEEMKKINADLLDRIAGLESQIQTPNREQEQRIRELTIASEMASTELSTARLQTEKLEEELRKLRAEAEEGAKEQSRKDSLLSGKDAELSKLRRDIELEKQRLSDEMEMSMATKRRELKQAEERIGQLQALAEEKEALVREVSKDARYAVEAYEMKLGDANSKRFNLENTIRSLEDQLAAAVAAQKAAESSVTPQAADTAAQIDNENLKAQIAHQQKKIASLEDQIEELQLQIEKENENTLKIIEKAKDGERRLREDVVNGRKEIATLRETVSAGKDKIAELELALKDQAHTLAGAQAEIEGYRIDLADLENMRMAQDLHQRSQQDKEKLRAQLQESEVQKKELEADLSKLTRGYAELREKHGAGDEAQRRPRASNGPLDAEKLLRGFQHITQELTSENADLRQKMQEFQIENEALKENMNLLEAAIEDKISREEEKLTAEENNGASAAEMANLRKQLAALQQDKADLETHYRQTVREQNREIQELESLVETKIYREDELERTIEELRRRPLSQSVAEHSFARPASVATNGSGLMCPLCDGEHNLDDCQLAKTGGGEEDSPTQRRTSTNFDHSENDVRTWCDNCDTSAHNTAECPQADDMF